MNFDLHLHVSLKPYLIHRGDDIDAELEAGILVAIDENNLAGDRLDSQSCLTQIIDGNITYAVTALHALEPDFCKPFPIKLIKLLTRLNDKLFKEISERTFTSWQYLNEEFKYIVNSQSIKNGKAVLVKKKQDPGSANKVKLIFSIEGCHSFMDSALHTDLIVGNVMEENKILDNFDAFFNDKEVNNYRFLYLTLTHIARSPFCAQAFAFPRRKPAPGSITPVFIPKNPGGIRKIGWEIIQRCLDRDILIDIKHMSYRSRVQYYKFLNGLTTKIPIIASHMGAAGMSFRDARQNWIDKAPGQYMGTRQIMIDKPEGMHGTSFNPISLNLFDEEIKLIVKSGGLIGLSFDQRILGVKDAWWKKNREYEIDFICEEDYEFLRDPNQYQSSFFPVLFNDFDYSRIFPSDSTVKTRRHIRYVTNNILRFVFAGGPETWKRLCIGSDYDGLLDAIDCCKDASQLGSLKDQLKSDMTETLRSIPSADKLFFVDQDNLQNDIDRKMDDIFGNNGIRFVTGYLKGIS